MAEEKETNLDEYMQNYGCSPELVKLAIEEAGSREEFLSAKETEVKGVIAKYGNDDVNASTTLDVKQKMADFKKTMGQFQRNMDSKLSNLTPEKLLNIISGPNGIPQPLNQIWGVTEKVLCWDGEIPFSLQDLIDALDIKFNFMLTWEICDRQGFNNPITGLMNSITRLEDEVNQLANVGPRLFNNLMDGVRGFIRNSGLPQQLQRCMMDKAIFNTAAKYKDKISLSDMNNLLSSLDTNICSKSNKGIGNKRNTFVAKSAMSPFVEGLAAYNRETAFASIISIANNPNIDSAVVGAVLAESIKAEPNPNTVQLLEMMVLLNAYKKDKNLDKKPSIDNMNALLLNSSNNLKLPDGSMGSASDLLLENALSITGGNQGEELKEVLSNVDENGVYIPPIQADVLLENMTDNYCESPKPKEDLKKIKALISSAIPNFKPEENVASISKAEPIMCLVNKDVGMTKGDKKISNDVDTNMDVYKTKKNDDPYFHAYIVNQTRKAMEAKTAS